MDGVTGRLACVDLSTESVTVEELSDDDFRKFLGGNGLAAKIMLERVSPGINPFSPENTIVFATGPITGTGVQGSDRTYIAAKSPLTGLFFDSCMGGRFATSLKRTGYDALVITGKAKENSYILITQRGIEIHNNGELVGKSPIEIRALLAGKLGDIEVCATGIAGENLVRYASIVHPRVNGRSGVAGRGGLGAVMGSKNLKAVAVQRAGGGKVKVHSKALLKDVKEAIQANMDNSPFLRHISKLGTPWGVMDANDSGTFGTGNLTTEVFESAKDISAEKLKESYYRKNISCNSCPVACGKLCQLGDRLVKNIEYESLYALGGMTRVADLEALLQANILCDDYGIDTISTGVAIAFAMECFEKGILSAKQTESRALRFGDARVLISLIRDIAHRQGIGDLLAEGTKRMSQRLGGDSWKYANQVKGLELAGHSARAIKTLSIGYATGTRGGSHQDTRSRHGPEMYSYEGKVEEAIVTQNFAAVGDSLVLCRYVMENGCGRAFNDAYTSLLKAVTGWNASVIELNEIGERIFNMERIFNVREGIRRKDDILPYKVMWEEIPEGPRKGARTPPEKLEEMLSDYYQLRGWDADGVPRKEVLRSLSLESYFTGSEPLL